MITATLFVAVFAFLLASFPARNPDVWGQLAAGRDLANGQIRGLTMNWAPEPRPMSGWLYNLTVYAVYSAFGGAGLVLIKATLVAVTGVLLLLLSRTRPGWLIPAFCTGLALLAMSTRLLLQPATASYLFLSVTLWLLWRLPRTERVSPLVSWPLLSLFFIWANTDRWFIVGLGVVALTWFGQTLDEPGLGRRSFGLRRAGSLASLVAVCLLNPLHLSAFEFGGLIRTPVASTARPVNSPFDSAYLSTLYQSPAELAYVPLLGLGLLSFVLARSRWRWAEVLPWLGLAVLSGVQVRTIPFFAVVAGPVLARNLQEFFARQADMATAAPAGSRRTRIIVPVLTGFAGLAFLACAWPGWLQAPPFEPRRWAIDTPPALQRGGEAICKWHAEGLFAQDAVGLHLSPASAAAFAWFCPDSNGVHDRALAAGVLGGSGQWADGLREAGVDHLIVYDPDRERLFAALRQLLADPDQWPLLRLEGDLAVFGWRDPARRDQSGLLQHAGLDFDRLALRPRPGEMAPPARPALEPVPRRWWEAFWRPAPPRPIDRDETALLLLLAEALRESAPRRHQAAWEAIQVAGLVGSAAGGSGAGQILGAHTRLTFFRPPLTEPGVSPDPLGALALAYQPAFAHRRDDSPVAVLYLAIRAARRALATNPDDARAHAALGEAYLRLLQNTRERAWSRRLTELVQLRRAQAAAALTRAVTLNPDLSQAHLSLGALYAEMGYQDLALKHQRAHLQVTRKAGPPPETDPGQFWEALAEAERRLGQLSDLVDAQERAYAQEAAGVRVLDRAVLANEKGLAGRALDVLLKSDISAFGAAGMALELELLVRTGRVSEVREWTSAEHQAALGAVYHWLRVRAMAASGDYALARAECVLLAGDSADSARSPRAVMARVVARAVLDGQPGPAGPAWVFGRALPRIEFHRHLTSLTNQIRRAADATVLNGLLALEAGYVDEAEAAFLLALETWVDDAAAAENRGLDFNARPIAQDCLKWIGAKAP